MFTTDSNLLLACVEAIKDSLLLTKITRGYPKTGGISCYFSQYYADDGKAYPYDIPYSLPRAISSHTTETFYYDPPFSRLLMMNTVKERDAIVHHTFHFSLKGKDTGRKVIVQGKVTDIDNGKKLTGNFTFSLATL